MARTPCGWGVSGCRVQANRTPPSAAPVDDCGQGEAGFGGVCPSTGPSRGFSRLCVRFWMQCAPYERRWREFRRRDWRRHAPGGDMSKWTALCVVLIGLAACGLRRLRVGREPGGADPGGPAARRPHYHDRADSRRRGHAAADGEGHRRQGTTADLSLVADRREFCRIARSGMPRGRCPWRSRPCGITRCGSRSPTLPAPRRPIRSSSPCGRPGPNARSKRSSTTRSGRNSCTTSTTIPVTF